jgi:Protein of unknown function (DUF3017)
MGPEPLDTSSDLAVITDAEAAATRAAATHPAATHGTTTDVAVPVRPARRRGRVARFVAEVPMALVIIGAGVGLVVIAMHHFRWGSLAVAAAVLGGALFRLVLPTRTAGLLAVRSRFTDVVTMGVIGGALLVLAAVTST